METCSQQHAENCQRRGSEEINAECHAFEPLACSSTYASSLGSASIWYFSAGVRMGDILQR